MIATVPQVEVFAGPGAEWDACVQTASGWTHFHRWGWKAVIERVFGHECLYLAARDAGGHVAAVLPLVQVRSFLFGDYLVSMPFVNYEGAPRAKGWRPRQVRARTTGRILRGVLSAHARPRHTHAATTVLRGSRRAVSAGHVGRLCVP